MGHSVSGSTLFSQSIKRVAVVEGGWSHEANLSAGPWICNALESMDIEVIPVRYESPGFIRAVCDAAIDVFFPQTLGAYGEDGTIQGLLDVFDAHYVGSGVTASSICANKFICSQFIRSIACSFSDLQSINFSAPDSLLLSEDQTHPYEQLVRFLGTPFVLKPAMSGASFGVNLIDCSERFESLKISLLDEFKYLIAEKFIEGTEHTIGLLEIDGIMTALDPNFVAKNSDKSLRLQQDKLHKALPEPPAEQIYCERLKGAALAVASRLGINGMCRLDMIVDGGGKIYILDVNTLPGLVPGLTAFPQMCETAGISYPQMIGLLLESACKPKLMRMPKLRQPPPAPELLKRYSQALQSNSLSR